MRPWSYSRLSTYEACPAQYKYSYIDKLKVYKESPAANRGSAIHESAENYLKGILQMYPPELQGVSSHLMLLKSKRATAEMEVSVTEDWGLTGYKSSDTYFRAIFDVCYKDGTILHIQDWKTGRIYDSHAQQMKDYAVIGYSLHPDLEEVHTRLIYTDLKVVSPTIKYPKNHIVSLRELMKGRTQCAEEDKVYPTRNGPECRWCPYSKKEGGPCKY